MKFRRQKRGEKQNSGTRRRGLLSVGALTMKSYLGCHKIRSIGYWEPKKAIECVSVTLKDSDEMQDRRT